MFQCDQLELSFGDRRIFSELNIRFTQKRVALLGPSGSGKSTLLRVLAGLEHRDAGDLRFNEAAFERPMWRHRRKVAYVPQEPLLSGSTLREALCLGLELQSIANPSDADLIQLLELLEMRHLKLDHDPSKVSGGERMRLAILRALLPKPQALLLDEPTAGLDPLSRASLLKFLLGEHSLLPEHMLLVSHDPSCLLAMDVCYQLDNHQLNELSPQEVAAMHPGGKHDS